MNETSRYTLVLVLIVFLITAKAFAASPGSLDPTFGVAGKLARDFPSGIFIDGAAIQADGKILLVGSLQNGSTRDFVVLRMLADGSPDAAFGSGGTVTTDFQGRFDDASDVALQTDGKIVVVGSSSVNGFSDIAAARYLPNGSLDTSFDGDGKFILTMFPGQVGDFLRTVAIQPDGKIVAGGGADSSVVLMRLNIDGSLDAQFDSDGVAVTTIGTGGSKFQELAVLPDGRLVAAGSNGGSCIAARYNSNGTLDTSFAALGRFIAGTGFFTQCIGMAVQADGKYVLAGQASPGNQYDSFIMRLNVDGTLDASFNSNGYAVKNVNPAGADLFTDIQVQSDGKLLAVGAGGGFPIYDFTVGRFATSGAFDTTFGGGGLLTTDITGNDSATVCLIYGDKLLVVGDNGGDGSSSQGIRAARFNLTVTPSASSDFDGDGTADHAVFRPQTGTWYVLRSSDGSFSAFQFGLSGDTPIDGDFDGDGRTDAAIFRPSDGRWWFASSRDGTVSNMAFGLGGDEPVAGDYDKDGKSDLAVWRPSNGTWYVLRSSSNYTSFYSFPFGQNGDIPIGSAP